jgi:CxxC-x17-CxxC domain-containing protein
MAFDDSRQGGGFKKQMFQGDWKCSKCGAEIKELPFEPDPERMNQLLCRTCHQERTRSFQR